MDRFGGSSRRIRGVRSVAVFEATKGAVVVVAGCGLLSLVHHDVQAAADRLVRHTHMNPARHEPRVFIELVSHLDDARLRIFAALAFLYAAARFAEAYGLWRGKVWAQWFAILSGAIYVPFEVIELAKRPTWLTLGILLLNLGVVGYMVWVRRSERHVQAVARSAA